MEGCAVPSFGRKNCFHGELVVIELGPKWGSIWNLLKEFFSLACNKAATSKAGRVKHGVKRCARSANTAIAARGARRVAKVADAI